jgi:hypothetical protein
MYVSALLGDLVRTLNKNGVTVMLLPDNQKEQKFTYNTNIRYEDDMGNDLDLKCADKIVKELEHCGDKLVLMFHTASNRSFGCNQMLYYDKAL